MVATPKTLARQIRAARVARESAPVRSIVRLAFTSETGVVRPEPVVSDEPVDEPDPHCFVCHRHTDHWGEHDDMVDAGTASYDDEGNVYPVPWF